jgi:uncharacterized protein YdeI (YjbR/CyaY-like superfamily)
MVEVGQKRNFKSREEFRSWLEKNSKTKSELWLIFYKKHVKKSYIQYDEAVEEALCFGWIDGIMKRIDSEKHVVRFTPRRKNSVWSESNIARVKIMIKEGKMTDAGLEKFQARGKDNGVEPLPVPQKLSQKYEGELKKDKKAWEIFKGLPPSHQKRYVFYIMEAKKEETRFRRVKKAVEMLKEENR